MEKTIVYIAGCPDAYPVEYYDVPSGGYRGVIPQLLQQFSQQSDYEVRYYEPGQRDRRQHLARNRQVDMVTCLEGGRSGRGENVAVLAAEVDGEPVICRLCLLDVAPAGLEQELRAFMDGRTAEERTGELIAAVQGAPQPREHRLEVAAVAMAVAAGILAGVVTVLALRLRRRLHQLDAAGEEDQETGLGNRASMDRWVRQRLTDRNRVLCTLFCFCFDPRRLRGPAGKEREAVLHSMASTLQAASTEGDVLARISDNGFAILRLCGGQEGWDRWLTELMERLGDCVPEGGTCPVAAGGYPLKAGDRNLDEMLYRGVQAAKAALEQGEAYRVCSEKAMASDVEEERLQGDIRRALNSGEFRVEIQFYVDGDSGRIVGGEALPTWEHPDRGSVPLERFLPIAEREELTDQLDAHNLEEACAFLDNIRQQGLEDFFLCCRLSRTAIAGQGFAQRLGEMAERYAFRRERLILGLTEAGIAREPQEAARNIQALKDMGFKVVLTGVGRRFTALFGLGDYPFDGVTLGRELMEQAESAAGPAVVGGVIRMGHELGISVLAEGVESVEQVRLLRRLSCDVMRGDQLYHAIPPWEARKKLLEQSNEESRCER